MSPQEKAKRHEEFVAMTLGGRRDPSSGAHWARKGDVVVDGHLYSCKSTTGRSISLRTSDWEEVCDQAYEKGLDPRMALRIYNPDRDDVYQDFLLLPLETP